MATSGVIKVGDSIDVVNHISGLINSGYRVKIGNNHASYIYYQKNGKILCMSNQTKQYSYIGINLIIQCLSNDETNELQWELVCPFSNAINSMKKIRIDYDKIKREVDEYYETVQSVVNFDEIELVKLIFEYVY